MAGNPSSYSVSIGPGVGFFLQTEAEECAVMVCLNEFGLACS